MLGDVIIAPTYIKHQADELDVGFEDEVALMIVHGLLHLLGYEHENGADADRMEARERELLAAAGRNRR